MAKNHKSGYGIIGLGRFGTAIANILANAGKDVMVIDEFETNIKKIRDNVSDAYLIGSLTQEALEETGISDCAVVIIGISKVDVSVLTTQIILAMGVPRVIAKADSKAHGMILEKIGAESVYPEMDTAAKLASVLMESKAIDLMQLNDDFIISEIKVPASLKGRTVKGLHLERFDLKLLAIETEPNITAINFKEDYEFKEGDQIVVLGKLANEQEFEKHFIKIKN